MKIGLKAVFVVETEVPATRAAVSHFSKPTMTRTSSISRTCLVAFGVLLAMPVATAGRILFYDSVTGGTALGNIASETDPAFVAGSDPSTSLGGATTFYSEHGSQAQTVTPGLGTGNDLMFRFGGQNDTLSGTLADAAATNGHWIGSSFTAAQNLTIDQVSFKLYVNIADASNYAARDAGLFVRIGNSGGFIRFGSLHEGNNGDNGTVVFADSFSVASGQEVQFRLAFTDRTKIGTSLPATASTRIGSIDVSATAGGDVTKVTTSSSAPTVDILSSLDDGGTGIDTALFDEDANANHARGQLFSLPDGAGAEYQITAITVKKSNTQVYSNDTVTMRIFEGTAAQWDTGTGHSTAIDGGDYYAGTTVTPLHTEVFTLSGTFTDNDFVTFTLSTPITVDKDSDYGFVMTYDQGDGTEDRFRHRENDNGGRISITTSDHGIADRSVVYYVQGNATGLALASPFQDRMVLQRGKPIKVWGWAPAFAAVSVMIDGNVVMGTSDAGGSWSVELPALSAGGPHQLVVGSGPESITVNDVLVGDVWFCFGQSNMVYTLNQMGSWHTAYENAIASNDNIRCLKIDQDAALGEENTAGMNWLDNSTAGSWTAVGSVFAHELNASSGVPVAIIWSAWGSSSIEGWLPLELTTRFPHFEEMMTLYQSVGEYRSGQNPSGNLPSGYSTNQQAIAGLIANGWSGGTDDIFMRTRPNIIYNKMVHPVRNYGVSGFIWYQGESNASDIRDVAQYQYTFPGMVAEYRERFAQGDLPFLGVQLPSINGASRSDWNWFRESQAILEDMSNGHVAVTVDTGSTDGQVHPTDSGKQRIGERLSLLARKYSLGESIVAQGPRFRSMSIAGDTATIRFDNDSGLTTTDAPAFPAGFEIAGADMVFHPATTTAIAGTGVAVSSSSVANPVAVRYAWDMLTKGVVNLVNGASLPAAPFRTDSWALPGLGAQAPQSVADSYDAPGNQDLVIPADGVLANDIDLNGDPLTAVLVSGVSHGSLSLAGDGSFTYTPTHGYTGPDGFVYKCNDGGLDSPDATVSIDVTAPVTGYAPWQSSIPWNPGDDDSPTGDPDHDGIVNFLEFAFDLDPLQSSQSGLPTLTPSGADFEYDFNNAQPGVTYEVLLSSDMITWSDPAFAVLTNESTTPVVIPSSEAVDGRQFVRLRVSE